MKQFKWNKSTENNLKEGDRVELLYDWMNGCCSILFERGEQGTISDFVDKDGTNVCVIMDSYDNSRFVMNNVTHLKKI